MAGWQCNSGRFLVPVLILVVLVGFVGCGDSRGERFERAYRLAQQLSSDGALSDTEVIRYSRVSRSLLERLARLKIKASEREVYVLERLLDSYQNLRMWPRAVEVADQLIRLQPTEPDWYQRKGQVLSQWSRVEPGRAEAAERAFQAALELDPQLLRARYGLGVLYAFRMDRTGEARRQLKRITDRKTVRAKQIPVVVEARFALGKLEFQQGNYRAAQDVYRTISEMGSIDSHSRFLAYKHRGQTYRQIGAPERARRMYQEAYQIQPTNSSVRNALRELGVTLDDRFEKFESSPP